MRPGRYYVAKKFCPFVYQPYKDCICNNINSLNVEEVVYYCAENFEKCEIYKRNSFLSSQQSSSTWEK